MAEMQLQWHVQEVRFRIIGTVVRNMERAGMFVASYVVRSISIGQPVIRRGNRLIGLNPSLPGNPPHVLTGRLRQSITHRVVVTAAQVIGFVGSRMIYARALELGYVGQGRRLLPRPYLRPAVLLNRARILSIIAGGS